MPEGQELPDNTMHPAQPCGTDEASTSRRLAEALTERHHVARATGYLAEYLGSTLPMAREALSRAADARITEPRELAELILPPSGSSVCETTALDGAAALLHVLDEHIRQLETGLVGQVTTMASKDWAVQHLEHLDHCVVLRRRLSGSFARQAYTCLAKVLGDTGEAGNEAGGPFWRTPPAVRTGCSRADGLLDAARRDVLRAVRAQDHLSGPTAIACQQEADDEVELEELAWQLPARLRAYGDTVRAVLRERSVRSAQPATRHC